MNNREAATLIWLGIGLAFVLRQRDVRRSMWEVGKCFVHLKVLGPILMLAGWTVGLVALAHAIGLWKGDQRNDTIIWFITVGIAFYFSLDKVKEEGFFRKSARRAVAATVFVEAYVNLAQLPLVGELLLLPLVVSLVMLGVVSQRNDEYARVHRFVDRLLMAVVVALAAYVAVRLISNFDAARIWRSLALPVWLTLGTLPLIYLVGLWSAYEEAFIRIDLRTDDPVKRRRAKRALLRAAHVRAAEVGGLAGHWIRDLAWAGSSADALAIVRRWRREWRSEQRASWRSYARASMREWLTEVDPEQAEIHLDALRRSWQRLDTEERATLKAEGASMASNGAAEDAIRSLPD